MNSNGKARYLLQRRDRLYSRDSGRYRWTGWETVERTNTPEGAKGAYATEAAQTPSHTETELRIMFKGKAVEV